MPPIQLSTKSSQYQNWKANKYSILTVTELGPPVSESSTRISKFYTPFDSEHWFNKTGIENLLPIGFNLGSSWLWTRGHNHFYEINRQLKHECLVLEIVTGGVLLKKVFLKNFANFTGKHLCGGLFLIKFLIL